MDYLRSGGVEMKIFWTARRFSRDFSSSGDEEDVSLMFVAWDLDVLNLKQEFFSCSLARQNQNLQRDELQNLWNFSRCFSQFFLVSPNSFYNLKMTFHNQTQLKFKSKWVTKLAGLLQLSLSKLFSFVSSSLNSFYILKITFHDQTAFALKFKSKWVAKLTELLQMSVSKLFSLFPLH